ncbi:MAG: translation initiation factor Sui1 [Desulfobacterales bacterium]|nr:translation initiation factor Sui1 [Desulfobacterales bacterium]
MRDSNSELVYSTEFGDICPKCGKQNKKCKCQKKKASAPKGDGKVRVERSTKGRKGKGVSLITGLPLEDRELKDLAKKLKQKCGTGGAVKDGVIEIQGDHREFLVEELIKLGFKAKKSGG